MKIRIPKGLDIQEIVEQDERQRAREVREAKEATRRQSFLQELQKSARIRKETEKKVERYCERRDAEEAEERRQAEYAAIVGRKLQEGR